MLVNSRPSDEPADVSEVDAAARERDDDPFGDVLGLDADAGATLRPAARVRPRWRVGFGAAVVLVVVGVGVAVVAGLLSPGGGVEPVAAHPSAALGGALTPAPTAPATAAEVMVHVVGQVRHPGVYELDAGARVIDAVDAAGGFGAAADRAALNLAQPVADGEQIYVPQPGEALPITAAASGSPAGTSGTGGAGAAVPGAKIDLNTATLEQLETLPRVGPALGQRILDWRAQNGRFAAVDDLKNVSGVGDKMFAALADLVAVG